MEKPPQLEKQEKFEQFAEEMQAGIDFIQSLDMLVEMGELSEEEAKQAQIVFEDFESWEDVKDTQEIKDMIMAKLPEDVKAIDEYTMPGSEGVGDIAVTVYPTNEEGVNLTKYKYEDETIVWALQPENFDKN